MRTFVLISVCALAAGATTSLGGSIVLTPTTVVLGPSDMAASLSVRNDTGAPVHFRVRPQQWRNSISGEMLVDSTDDLMVFPVDVQLAPGESRRIRLGSRQPRDPRQPAERAYRLLLESVPDSNSAPSAPSIKTRLQFSLPVFLQPKDRAIRIDMPPPDMSGGQARLEMTNAGRLHVTPTSIALTGLDQHGQVVWTRPLRTWYLLAGETRHYTAPVPPEECRHTTTVAAEAFFAEDARLVLRERRALASSMACAAK